MRQRKLGTLWQRLVPIRALHDHISITISRTTEPESQDSRFHKSPARSTSTAQCLGNETRPHGCFQRVTTSWQHDDCPNRAAQQHQAGEKPRKEGGRRSVAAHLSGRSRDRADRAGSGHAAGMVRGLCVGQERLELPLRRFSAGQHGAASVVFRRSLGSKSSEQRASGRRGWHTRLVLQVWIVHCTTGLRDWAPDLMPT